MPTAADTAIFYVPAALAFLTATALLTTALRRSRQRKAPRCPKCEYDLVSTPWRDGAITCPECGRATRRKGALHKPRLRRRLGVTLALLALATALALGPDLRDNTWPRLVPTRVLVELTPWIDAPRPGQFVALRPGARELLQHELFRRVPDIAEREPLRRRLCDLALLSLETRLRNSRPPSQIWIGVLGSPYWDRSISDGPALPLLSAEQEDRLADIFFAHGVRLLRDRWPADEPLPLSVASPGIGTRIERWSMTFLDLPSDDPERTVEPHRGPFWATAPVPDWNIALAPRGAASGGELRMRITLSGLTVSGRSWTRDIALPVQLADAATDVVQPFDWPGADVEVRERVRSQLRLAGGPAPWVRAWVPPPGYIDELDRFRTARTLPTAIAFRLTFLSDGEKVACMSYFWTPLAMEPTSPTPVGDLRRFAAGLQNPSGWTVRIEGDPIGALYDPDATHYWSGSTEIPLSELKIEWNGAP